MQHGRLVFRLKANFLVLHEQNSLRAFSHHAPLICASCRCRTRIGELDVLQYPLFLFYCECCLIDNKQFSPPIHVRTAIELHYIQASSLFVLTYDQQKENTDEFLFWFGHKWRKKLDPSRALHPRQIAIAFYKRVAKTAKKSVDMLSLCLSRLKIYKDLRQFIVKMIWPNEIICWMEE